jgi:Tol biopolymer transport system component
MTAAAMVAALGGTPTPPPSNWVTPVVVPNSPTPESVATAAFLRAEATARAYLYGTPTPLLANAWTATPVPPATPMPLLIPIELLDPTPTQTPRPAYLLSRLRGRIIFHSDRFGGVDTMLMDPDGSRETLVTDPTLYDVFLSQESLSSDGRYLVLQRQGRRGLDLFVRDLQYDVETQVTFVGAGIAYDAAWSPDGTHVAYASDQDGDDEIYVVTREGARTQQLTQNPWQWDKHPSYSPDGGRIVYASNSDTGRMQIWVMNADGSGKRNISNNSFSEWDPIWVK